MSFKMNKSIYVAVLATIFSMAASISAQVRPYRVSDYQVQTILNRLETRTDAFRRQMDRALDRSVLDNTRREENITQFVTDFENATDSLRRNFNERDSVAADVEEVLNRAVFINNFMRNNTVSTAAQNQWNLIRTDLNTLANYYRVSWTWNTRPNYPNYGNNNPDYGSGRGIDSLLTGTYRLNVSQSDNVLNVIDRSLSSIRANANQNERIRRNLERRLTPPDMLMIEKRGQNVIMASSMSPQVSFVADGRAQTETNANGRSMRVSATATNRDLTINYEGDRMNDFFVSFMPDNDRRLRVMRRVYLENRNETVTVTSVYDKIDNVARWNDSNYNNYPNNTGTTTGDFIIANNTRLTATLDTPLSTRDVRDGQRFTMTVTSPSQYRGAIIEGWVNGQRSGVVSGRASLSLNFDTIRLRNGSTYRFAGIVDQVRDSDGDTVSVNNEGAVRDSNQTTRTVTRAGIGAALGAIIGAIAGGGSGAAVGAAIGAGAGAGTVVLQGRDNLELGTGAEFTITATAPANVRSYR